MLTVDRRGQIKEVTSFITRSRLSRDRHFYDRWPEQPMDSSNVLVAFEGFGLPDSLD
jgi:hypothetical protein